MYFVLAISSFFVLLYKGVISASGDILWGGTPFGVFFICIYILRKIILKIQIGTLRQELELCRQDYEYQKRKFMTVGRQVGSFLENFTDVAEKIAGISNDFVVGSLATGAKLLFEGAGGKENESERKARLKYEDIQARVCNIEEPAKLFSFFMFIAVGAGWYLSYKGYIVYWSWYLDQWLSSMEFFIKN